MFARVAYLLSAKVVTQTTVHEVLWCL
jgi:hypothetical protein